MNKIGTKNNLLKHTENTENIFQKTSENIFLANLNYTC